MVSVYVSPDYSVEAAKIACPGGWYRLETDDTFTNFRLVLINNGGMLIELPENAKQDQLEALRFVLSLLEDDLT